MRVDVGALMGQTLTVCNRVTATSPGGSDSWVVTVLTGFWHDECSSQLSTSNGAASGEKVIRVQVAEADSDGYVAPEDWEGSGWTLRPGDRVVLGEVEPEDLTTEGLEEACAGLRVGTITDAADLRLRDAGTALRGLSKWASLLYCEAV